MLIQFKKQLHFIMVMTVTLCTVACEPAFIAEGSERLSRHVGLVDDFDITRWHSMVYARESHLVLASQVADATSRKSLLLSQQKAFSRYFSSSTVDSSTSVESALGRARQQGANFLIMSDVITSEKYKNMDGSHSESYKHAAIILTVIDVNSAKVVDKINLAAKSSLVSFSGSDLGPLSYKPMIAVAKEMVGEH